MIKKIKLKIIKNKKGDILKYLNKHILHPKKFGEIYFNQIKKNQKTGWIFHKKYFCYITVPVGKIQFTYKKNFKSKGKSFVLSSEKYFLLRISPKIWFSFKGIKKSSLLVNTITGIHNDKEVLKNNISI